jgi:hypothetical protein
MQLHQMLQLLQMMLLLPLLRFAAAEDSAQPKP